jgi:lysozyme
MLKRATPLALATTLAFGVPVSAQEWQTLENEPSRADLFEQFIAAKDKNTQIQEFALIGPFVFPADTTYDQTKKAPRTDVLFGIDVSHYEGTTIKFDTMRDQNVRFVFAKATQGVGYKDGQFATYWAALGALPPDKRVWRGAYHFMSSQDDPVAQADSFLRLLDQSGGLQPADLPAVLDLEWDIAVKNGPDRWQGQDPDKILDKVVAWLERVKTKTQKIPIVYTAKSWWRSRGIPEAKFARLRDYKIWIADYSSSSRAVETPGVPNNSSFHLWQFSETAVVSSGYGGKLDANIYFGDDLKFLNDFQIK